MFDYFAMLSIGFFVPQLAFPRNIDYYEHRKSEEGYVCGLNP